MQQSGPRGLQLTWSSATKRNATLCYALSSLLFYTTQCVWRNFNSCCTFLIFIFSFKLFYMTSIQIIDGTRQNYFLWLKNFWWKNHIYLMSVCVVCLRGREGGDNSPVSVYPFSLLWAMSGINDPTSLLDIGTDLEEMMRLLVRVMYLSLTVRNKIKALRTCWFFSRLVHMMSSLRS